MNDILKKRISIGVAVCCLSLAIGITVKRNFSGGYDGGSAGPIQMLCVNPKCGQAFELSEKEFSNLTSQSQGGKMMMPMETPVFKCSKCNQKSAYVAMKCEKCGNVFVPNYQSSDGFDKCPKCGFSPSQQEQK
jgi:Zn finger protein HypA/HybF involved in hydrogenase expression